MIQSIELLKNRYYNLITYVDVNNTTEEILQILERLANLLNIEKAVENEITIQSTNIVLEENRDTPRFCRKISLVDYSKYAFAYIKKFYFIPLVEAAQKEIEDAEAELEKIKGERNPIVRERLESTLRSKKVIKGAIIKARNSKYLEEVQEPFRTNLTNEIELDYNKNGGILPEYIKEYAYRELTALAYGDAFDFYPTPTSVVNKMVELANIKDSQLILEPSAGKGDILDAIAHYNNTVQLDFCEFNKYNTEILELKCYNRVGQDFLMLKPEQSAKYDRILMNPPFEDRADIQHIRHAFEFLKDDGILVAVITNKSISNATPETAKMRQDVELFGQIVELDENVMTTDAERKATVSISLIVLERARYLAYLAQRETLVNIEDIQVNDYFLDTQSDLIWQVIEYNDFILKLANKIAVGVEKTYDLGKIPLRSSLRPISEEDALEIIKTKRNSIEELKTSIESQCNNMDFNTFCANGEYIPLTNLITARPQFAQSPKYNYLEEINISIQPGFNLSQTAIDGFNLATEAMETSGAFLLTDGTGAGKTIQQLLVAKYFVDKHKKPFLIVTKDDRIIEQAFIGDAKRIGINNIIKKIPLELLYSPTKMAKFLEGEFIYIMTYTNFDLVQKPDGEASNAKELEGYNKAKQKAKESGQKWDKELRELVKLYPSKEDKKQKTYLKAKSDIEFKKENDPALAELYEREEEWRLWNKKLYNAIGNKLCGISFDECHELKNWDDYDFQKGFRAKRAMWVSEVCDHRLFVSATPCDRAEAMLYLYQANVFPSKKFFEKFLIQAGFVKVDEKKNNMGKIVKRAALKAPKEGGDSAIRAQLVQNVYEDMTEDGKMIKREIPLTNYNIDLINVQVPQTALDTIARIETYFADYEREKKDAKDSGEEAPKREGSNVYDEILKSLEPYKISKTIEIVENEIKNCRSVVVFASLVAEGETGKQWGEIKGGTVETLYNYFSNLYGEDKVGKVVGAANEKARAKVLQDVADFQQNKKFIIIATPQAGGTGISLDDQLGTRPRSLICMTAPLNAEGNVQMLGRIYRLQTKTCANAFYIFAEDNYVEEWLAELVANKMILLNATVGGEVEKLNIGSLKMGDVDDSLDSLESFKNTTGNDKEDRITSHKLYHRWSTNDWIDGADYPDNINLKIRYIQEGRKKGNGKIQIKSTSKANLLSWALSNKETLDNFGFKLISDRYEGTMYSCDITYSPTNANNTEFRERWGWVINIILPQFSRFITGEDTNTYNVGDILKLTQSQPLGGKAGDKVEVVNFRKRPVTKIKVSEKIYKDVFEYLYDVNILDGDSIGVKLLRLKSFELAFENATELMSKLDYYTQIKSSLDEINTELKLDTNSFKYKNYDVINKHLELSNSYSDVFGVWSRYYKDKGADYLFTFHFDTELNNKLTIGSFNAYNEQHRLVLPMLINFINKFLNTDFTIENSLKDYDYETYAKYIAKNNESSLPKVTIPVSSGSSENRSSNEDDTNKSENVGVEVITQNEDTSVNYNPYGTLKTRLGFSITAKGKEWIREILSYNPNVTSGYSFQGEWMNRVGSSDDYSTSKLYLYAITINNMNNYALFTIDSNRDINVIHTLKDTNNRDWAKEFWKYIDNYYKGVPLSDDLDNLDNDSTLSDKIEDDKFKDNREKYDVFVKKTFGNDFKIGIDKDFVNVYNKDNQIVGQIVKYDGKIIKGQIDMFSDINSNNYLAELLELRNLLLLKTAIKNKKVEEYNTLFGLSETTDRNEIRNSIFDTLETYYNKVKTGTFEMNDLLNTIAPVIRI